MGVTGAGTAAGLGSDLVDVAALPLDELDALPDTVLGDLLRRVVADDGRCTGRARTRSTAA
ncbi:hypothetical protein ACIQOV_26140, partial [Kitasatospora sp. NPDC091257]